jgi:hypothetical protein
MNSALSVPWGAVGYRDNRGITLLQLLVTIGITGSLLAAAAPNIASVTPAPGKPPPSCRTPAWWRSPRTALHVYRDRGRKLLDTGWLGCRGEDPTHSGTSRHLDLGAECDRIRLAKDRSDCDDRHPNSWDGTVAVAVSAASLVRVE